MKRRRSTPKGRRASISAPLRRGSGGAGGARRPLRGVSAWVRRAPSLWGGGVARLAGGTARWRRGPGWAGRRGVPLRGPATPLSPAARPAGPRPSSPPAWPAGDSVGPRGGAAPFSLWRPGGKSSSSHRSLSSSPEVPPDPRTPPPAAATTRKNEELVAGSVGREGWEGVCFRSCWRGAAESCASPVAAPTASRTGGAQGVPAPAAPGDAHGCPG